MTATPALELNQIRKSFGAVDVIHGVDLSIQEGEFVVFVGPSGCGKSTLLRLIAGLDDPTSGDIVLQGRRVNNVPAAERGLSMVFQSYALYPHMSVRSNRSFGLENFRMDRAEIKRRVDDAARLLQIDQLLDRRPGQLSGGQRQRVAIGRAIVREPKVFLFDEPLSNLDAELRVQMRLEIAKLHNDLRATMIYVTHDQVEAMTLADKIVVLRAGIVEQVGSPIGLYQDPDNVFVAGFIGSPRMNFLAATAGKTGKTGTEIALDDFGGVRFVRKLEGSNIAPGRKLLVGIRPEQFGTGGKVAISVTIDVVENLGGVAYAYAGREGGEPLTMQLPGNTTARDGDRHKASFEPADCFVFDAETQQRIR